MPSREMPHCWRHFLTRHTIRKCSEQFTLAVRSPVLFLQHLFKYASSETAWNFVAYRKSFQNCLTQRKSYFVSKDTAGLLSRKVMSLGNLWKWKGSTRFERQEILLTTEFWYSKCSKNIEKTLKLFSVMLVLVAAWSNGWAWLEIVWHQVSMTVVHLEGVSCHLNFVAGPPAQLDILPGRGQQIAEFIDSSCASSVSLQDVGLKLKSSIFFSGFLTSDKNCNPSSPQHAHTWRSYKFPQLFV